MKRVGTSQEDFIPIEYSWILAKKVLSVINAQWRWLQTAHMENWIKTGVTIVKKNEIK